MTADRLAGMTVNERLFELGLIDEFGRAAKQRNKKKMTDILLAANLTDEQANQTADAILANPARYGY
ncbi:hypothetical protein E4K72_19815 [Oxalobacteraceae bacterium OM1]|nr:hypothetical protein E4K72_19815 [Oxalobacteraceae bacterium OM1]